MKPRLFTPGPTQIPPEVGLRMAEPILHHRSPAFIQLFEEINQGLGYLFQTSGPVLILTSSGTGAMEGAVVNLLSPGDEVLIVEGGKFGERWREIGQAYGLTVHRLPVPWGEAVDPAALRESLVAHRAVRAVFLTHVETSTGALTDLRSSAEMIRQSSEALVVVDAVSSLGGEELRPEAWGLDLVVSGSQKGMMVPPGLAFAWLSPRAWEAAGQARLPRYYFDFRAARAMLEVGETPFTPAVSLLMGLAAALRLIEEEGLEAIWNRHGRLALGTRAGLRALGLELYPASPAHVLTTARVPPEIDGGRLVKLLQDHQGLTVAGGQGELKGQVFRIAHLGYYDELDILGVVGGVEEVLTQLGWALEWGAGVAASQQAMRDQQATG